MIPDNQDIISLLADESFQRWLAGTASEAESKQWQKWLNAAPARRETWAEAKTLWQAAQFQPAALPQVEIELQKLQQRLELSQANTIVARRSPVQGLKFARETGLRFSWKSLGAFAMAAAVLFAVFWRAEIANLLNHEETQQTAFTEYGQRKQFQLPDGSLVVLNAHSTLRFSSDWGKASERSVMLHGEAYFEVVPRMRQNSTEPLAFVVRTGDGEIRVVGTKFVVYERNFGTRVVVEEGSVKVNPVNAKAAQTLLAAGQLSEFRRGDTSVVTQSAGSGFHTTWWREDWQLEGTTFAEVIRRLEETYNVRVEVQDEALLQRKLSGAVENRDLEILIAALAKALRVDVSREGSVIKFGDSLDQEQ